MTKSKKGKTKAAVNNSDSEEEMSQLTGVGTPAPSQTGQQSGSAATSSQGNAMAYTWNNSNPKMTKMLEEDYSNFRAWHEAILNLCKSERCQSSCRYANAWLSGGLCGEAFLAAVSSQDLGG
jgi:hypothetical protein